MVLSMRAWMRTSSCLTDLVSGLSLKWGLRLLLPIGLYGSESGLANVHGLFPALLLLLLLLPNSPWLCLLAWGMLRNSAAHAPLSVAAGELFTRRDGTLMGFRRCMSWGGENAFEPSSVDMRMIDIVVTFRSWYSGFNTSAQGTT